MKKIQTDKAAQAVGPYSQGIDSGDTIYLSGQLGDRKSTRLNSSHL